MPGTNTVEVDFVLHGDSGPAGAWAGSARPGDRLGMVGPSALYAGPVSLTDSISSADWLLLAGDETALPAIGTLLEALPERTRAQVYVEVAERAEQQTFRTAGDVTLHWLHRDGTQVGQAKP